VSSSLKTSEIKILNRIILKVSEGNLRPYIYRLDLEKMTGISKKHASQAIRSLIEKSIIFLKKRQDFSHVKE
jgi:hypothetical protein